MLETFPLFFLTKSIQPGVALLGHPIRPRFKREKSVSQSPTAMHQAGFQSSFCISSLVPLALLTPDGIIPTVDCDQCSILIILWRMNFVRSPGDLKGFFFQSPARLCSPLFGSFQKVNHALHFKITTGGIRSNIQQVIYPSTLAKAWKFPQNCRAFFLSLKNGKAFPYPGLYLPGFSRSHG